MASLPYPLNRLNNYVRVGMARMPYPPTDTPSSVFKKPVLLFFCLFKNNMFSCSSVFSNNNMFSCPLVFPQQHVLMFFCLFKQQHVLLSFQTTTCSHVLLSFKTTCSHVLLSFKNNMFFCLSPKRAMFSIQSCLYVAKKKRLRATLPAVKP